MGRSVRSVVRRYFISGSDHTPTDPDDPNLMQSINCSINRAGILGNQLRASQTFTVEGNQENASFDKNFTIQVMHDPNKDEDNDGLTYSQELALGTSDNNPDSDGDGFTDGQEFALTHRPF